MRGGFVKSEDDHCDFTLWTVRMILKMARIGWHGMGEKSMGVTTLVSIEP